MQTKDNSNKSKAKRIQIRRICPTNNSKGSSSDQRDIILKEKPNLQKVINSTGNGKYVGNFFNVISVKKY